MNFTAKKMSDINKRYNETTKANGLGIELVDGSRGASMCKNGMVFASVEELSRLIADLQMLKDVIEDETGLII